MSSAWIGLQPALRYSSCTYVNWLNSSAGALTKANIRFTPAVGCVFCWIDLRGALPEPTWEAERELWEVGFVQRCGFIITPGLSLLLLWDDLQMLQHPVAVLRLQLLHETLVMYNCSKACPSCCYSLTCSVCSSVAVTCLAVTTAHNVHVLGTCFAACAETPCAVVQLRLLCLWHLCWL